MTDSTLKIQAQAAFQAQRFMEAATLYRQACQTDPSDADAWFMLGAISGQTGDFHEAEHCFKKTTELVPGSFAAWDNLGIARMYLGKNLEAEKSFLTAIQCNPDHFPAYNNLGNLLRSCNRLEESVNCFREALRINPSYAEAHNNLALTLREMGRTAEATMHFRKAVELLPVYAEAYHNLGDTMKMDGNLDGAINHYRKALSINPELAESHLGVAALYEELNYRDKALSHFESAFRIKPASAKAISGISRIKVACGQVDEAWQLLQENIDRFPGDPDVAVELSAILILRRDYTGALQQIKPFFENNETRDNIALVYARLAAQIGHEDQAIKRLESASGKTGLSAYQQESIELQLARLHDRKGNYAEAFRHCLRANSARTEASDLARHLAEMQAIRDTFSREFLADCTRSSIFSDKPVFIIGMPRSGTSLVEQVLASHPGVHGGGELTFLWDITKQLPSGPYPGSVGKLSREQLDECASNYLDRLNRLSASASRITDKLPHNFLHVGLINILFPGARIIHCVRDARDTCVSILFQKFNLNHIYARDPGELGIYYRHYEQLMQHWREVTRVPMLEIGYEDLVNNFEDKARAIVDYCDLPWDASCLHFYKSRRVVLTPSHDQVSKPIYSSSIGRWKHYESQLQPLISALEVPD